MAKELYPNGHYRPNLVHYFIRLLHEKSRLLRIYTQNIDSLERSKRITPFCALMMICSFLYLTVSSFG